MGLFLSSLPSPPLPPHCNNRGTPSAWIVRWSHLIVPGATVLDIACGSGRHLAWFAGRGHAVTGIDRDLAAARDLKNLTEMTARATLLSLVCADMENSPWCLMQGNQPQEFGAVVVTNYLWRPLLATIRDSVAPSGVLLYETFTQGNETVGRPARPDFLLGPGELLEVCHGWHVVAYECGYLPEPARYVQRIAAVRPGKLHATGPASHHPL